MSSFLSYSVNKKQKYIQDAGLISTYGITASDNSGILSFSVYDVSASQDFVENLAFKFNNKNVSKYHTMDVIEDALT